MEPRQVIRSRIVVETYLFDFVLCFAAFVFIGLEWEEGFFGTRVEEYAWFEEGGIHFCFGFWGLMWWALSVWWDVR